jgi:hypothetical protein
MAKLQALLGCLVVLVACEAKTEDDGMNGVGGGGSLGGSTAAVGGAAQGGAAQGGAAQGGATSSDFACETNQDCTLRAATCCGVCGAPALDDMIALSVDGVDAYAKQVCGTGPAMCPACATMLNPDLFATCDSGACQAVDLTQSEMSACTTASDCTLRAATCCECGASLEVWNLVAVAKTSLADYAAAICEPVQACAECMPIYPTAVTLDCVSGHCKLQR